MANEVRALLTTEPVSHVTYPANTWAGACSRSWRGEGCYGDFCESYVWDVQSRMLTIYETPTLAAEAAKVWSTEERLEFFAWIAREPEAGVVIPGSGGCRKVRWSRPGMGKQGD